jgi:MoCo/4Fe-4S cofactor protein with predicted Tat translocation signal
MEQKKYWQSFGELTQDATLPEANDSEFGETLPFEDADSKGLLDAQAPRRDFLKYLGFSTAAAMVAASCKTPVKKAVPFLNRPDNIVPGVSDYYATTFVQGGEVIPVVAKVRDGRPIKIEGNDLSSLTKGGTSAAAQASVLDLYDINRLRFPQQKDGKEISSFDAADKMIGEALAKLGGAPVVLLTGTINSPTTLDIISAFLAKYPGSRHVTYDAMSHTGMLLANEATYGKRAIPSYHFDKAKTIVSLGADFLGSWLTPVEFNRQYSTGRKVNEKNPTMSRHFQFEGYMSMTGANADERIIHRPSETGAVALALYKALGGAVTAPELDAKVKAGIEKAAKALNENKGEALVVCGSNDVNVQIIVNAINEAIGSNGKTINWAATNNARKGIDGDMATLIADMNAGKVGALMVYDANPVYDFADGDNFKKGLQNVKLTVSFSDRRDETTDLCQYIIPTPHYLESWGDAEGRTGYISLQQPTIHPLFKSRPFQSSLLKWSGAAQPDYNEYFKTYWTGKLGGQENFDKTLQAGVIEPAAMTVAGGAFNSGRVAEAAGKLAAGKKGGATEVVFYQKTSMREGRQASNPWIQEMPDPVSRATWDNYAMISPAMAKSLLGIDVSDKDEAAKYDVHPEKPQVSVKVGNKEVILPAVIIPGMHPNVVAVAVGYGRSEKVGNAAKGAGKNVYPMMPFDGTATAYSADAAVAKASGTYKVAMVQVHGDYRGRKDVMREFSLNEFKAKPAELREEREAELKPFGGIDNFEKEGTIYPYYDKPGVKWGMSIDLNSCTGCGACVVACNAENNIPVVGKMEVARGHEMHWMRIDRYFSGDAENPDVVFQPMLCQHCDNAPCENVCPVAATNHSTEGLNQMTYNRCIGTRYCANNCPYKVRRFNWADYTGADSFKNNQKPLVDEGKMDQIVLDMNDDLTRMVLNPDVTVRSRGVIEKCSFCVQRLQEGKLKAKKEDRVLTDSDIKTACQSSCPTDAIVFGNANSKESQISKVRAEEGFNRQFYVLESIHTLPNVNYLAKIRNTERAIAGGHEGKAENKTENKAENKAEGHSAGH